jgi:hypothetical protein
VTFTPIDGTLSQPQDTGVTATECIAYNDDTLCFIHSGAFTADAGTGYPVTNSAGIVTKYVQPGPGESLRASFQHFSQENVTITQPPIGPTPVPTPQTLQDWPKVQEVTMKGVPQIIHALNKNTDTANITINGRSITMMGDGGVFRETAPISNNMVEYVKAMGPDFEKKLQEGAIVTFQTCTHHYWEGYNLAIHELTSNVSLLDAEEKWALEALNTGSASNSDIVRATALVRKFLARTGKRDILKQFDDYLKPARTAAAQRTGVVVAFFKEINKE